MKRKWLQERFCALLFWKKVRVLKRNKGKRILVLWLILALLAGCGVAGNTTAETKQTAAENTLEDGRYFIDVDSSSSMFRIVSAVLTVEDGDMSVAMTLSGHGYLRLFLGIGEEALDAEESDFYYFEEDEDGAYTYTIPVEALDTEFDCAAWSINREKWYDRILVLKGDTIRPWVADGEYAVDVTLEGGTGRSEITSPAVLKIEEGQMTAQIEWSSPYYDYMVVDFIKYYPINEEGNSVFEIPVKALDQPLKMAADTVAMSTPHEIEYVLTFHCEEVQ